MPTTSPSTASPAGATGLRLVLAGALVGACAGGGSGATPSNGSAPPKPTPGRSIMTDPVSLSCTTTTAADGTVTVRMDAVNRSTKPVHVLDSPKLPYLLFDGRRVTVLHGVNDPDPDLDYYGIEIPLTRPLAPDEHLTAEARVVPLVPRHHYEQAEAPVALPASFEVVCKLAYGELPIDASHRAAMSINQLLAWQRWVEATPLTVTRP